MILSSWSPHHTINAQLLECGQRVNEPGVITRTPGNQHKYSGYLKQARRLRVTNRVNRLVARKLQVNKERGSILILSKATQMPEQAMANK